MLNKLILNAFLSISLALSFTGAANATLISQDILFEKLLDVDQFNEPVFAEAVTIGHVSVSLGMLDVEYGVGYLSGVWKAFSFYGYEMDTFDPNFNDFFAIINPDDLFAGIESLDFNVTLFDAFEFSGFIDAYDIENNVGYTLYNYNTDEALEAGRLSFGDATVVPTPATLVLFLTAVAGLVTRRKKS